MKKDDKGVFVKFAEEAVKWTGRPYAFVVALVAVIVWAATGPIFDYSDTWQLIINTSTTIVTFLMVFLIQNSQNRDTKALQLKLDELIRATQGAHTVLLDLEELSEKEQQEIQDRYEEIAAEGRKRLEAGKSDTNIPKVILNQKL